MQRFAVVDQKLYRTHIAVVSTPLDERRAIAILRCCRMPFADVVKHEIGTPSCNLIDHIGSPEIVAHSLIERPVSGSKFGALNARSWPAAGRFVSPNRSLRIEDFLAIAAVNGVRLDVAGGTLPGTEKRALTRVALSPIPSWSLRSSLVH